MIQTINLRLLQRAIITALLSHYFIITPPALAKKPSSQNGFEYIGKIKNITKAEDICINGDYAYIASDKQGLLVMNLSSPSEPKEILRIPLKGYTKNVSSHGNYLYLTIDETYFSVFDLSDPLLPKEISRFNVE